MSDGDAETCKLAWPQVAAGIGERGLSLHRSGLWIDAAIQHDVTDIDGIVGQHVSLPPRVELGRDGVTIATGDHFVDDAEAVAVIRPLGAGLVDMETYAYAWVAAQFGVPIRVIKAVSDRAQDDAITDWRTAVTACSAQLREFVLAEYGV